MRLMNVPSADAPYCLDPLIPGAVNLRDLGGLAAGEKRVRRGLLYRSGMTHQIEAEGLARLAAEFSVRTVIDLRSDEELQRDGVAEFDKHGLSLERLAVYGVTAATPDLQRKRFWQMARREYDWPERYKMLLIEHADSFARFVRLLAMPETLPAIFHCAAGRDRTGVAAALVLSLLGVEDEIIAEDYARSGGHLSQHVHRYTRLSRRMSFSDADLISLFHTEAKDMSRFLTWLNEAQGGAVEFCLRNGVSAEEISVLRERLLSP
jgi:protein-tyrosine phosphatase